MNREKLKYPGVSVFNSLMMNIPIFIGVLLLVSPVTSLVPRQLFVRVCTANKLLNPLIGGVFGSISAGNPITSHTLEG